MVKPLNIGGGLCGSLFCLYAPVAQLVEHIPFKDGVLGSNPSGRTKASVMKLVILEKINYL